MRTIRLDLTPLQLRGLAAIAGEGGEGLFNDPAAAKAYIGDARAVRAAREALDIVAGAARASRGQPKEKPQ